MDFINSYVVEKHVIEEGLKDYITEPGLGTESGILGAFLLAKKARSATNDE